MNKLESLFGATGSRLALVAYAAIFLILIQAVLPALFIIYMGFFSPEAHLSVNKIASIWFDKRHTDAIVNSIILSIFISVILTVISAFLALLFRSLDLTGNRFIYSISIIPLLIPDQVFGIVGRVVFDPSFGLFANHLPDNLLIDRYPALFLTAFIVVLKWLPAMIVIADSSILAMGRSKLFQIRMDYCKFWRSALRVYLPQMRNVLFIVLSLGFLIGFRQHELAYELNSGGGGFVAETWSQWNYRELFEFANMPAAALEALLVLFVLLIPILLIRRQAQVLSDNEV